MLMQPSPSYVMIHVQAIEVETWPSFDHFKVFKRYAFCPAEFKDNQGNIADYVVGMYPEPPKYNLKVFDQPAETPSFFSSLRFKNIISRQ